MCISWTNKGLGTINMHGATTKIGYSSFFFFGKLSTVCVYRQTRNDIHTLRRALREFLLVISTIFERYNNNNNIYLFTAIGL